MMMMKATKSQSLFFCAVALLFAVVAGMAAPAAGQRVVAPGFPPVTGGTPIYTVESEADTCIAVLSLDMTGHLVEVNVALVPEESTLVVTPPIYLGGALMKPVFVPYAPTEGIGIGQQRCAGGPIVSATLTDVNVAPTIFLSSLPGGNNGAPVIFNQPNTQEIGNQNFSATISFENISGGSTASATITATQNTTGNTTVGPTNVNTLSGFSFGLGVTNINYRSYPNGASLFSQLSACIAHSAIYTGNGFQFNC